MAQGGTSSRFGNFFDVGYNICLIFGTAALLFSYREANIKDVDITVQANTLKSKIQEHETVAIRSKRSVSLDGVFKRLGDRLDLLEQRFENTSAFAKAEKSPFAALLPFLRGLRGPPGSPGQKGDRGLTGKRGRGGRKGEIGPRGHHIDHEFNTTGTSVYTRWGRTSCPKQTGAKLLYSG
ncbi:macrophage scavenger receptor types I and II-like [Rhopilema esculentum]|uniref:macrophage scavenger receptor types I and II-like n=1 Tax=Rhopilema esculentum TaxID=499914 RepID=UPI0031DF0864